MSIEDSIASIRRAIVDSGIPPSRLAKMADLHANSLRGFREPKWNPTSKTLIALENAILRFNSARATIPANPLQSNVTQP